jgi:mRNA interferase MazF
MKRGDVVLVYIPFVGAPGGKTRPAVVVQSDPLNAAIQETVIAEITSNVLRASQSHQVLIDVSEPDGAASGLLSDSAIRCQRLHTIPQSDVQRTIGSLSAALLSALNAGLKSALAIP